MDAAVTHLGFFSDGLLTKVVVVLVCCAFSLFTGVKYTVSVLLLLSIVYTLEKPIQLKPIFVIL